MNRLILTTLAAVTLFVLSPMGSAQRASSLRDPDAILRAARDRDSGERVSARMRMTIRPANGAPRTRVMQTWARRVSGGVRTLAIFESPANIRNMGLLTYDHFDADRSDEQWLYMPALRRTTRISSASRAGAFASSDFSFADFTTPDPERYETRLVEGSVDVGGERAWHLELTPRTASTRRETGYERVELWIGQQSLLALRTRAVTTRARTVKYMQAGEVRRVSGIYMPRVVVARTVRDGQVVSESLLEQLEVRVGDTSVTDALFNPARLERGL